MTRRRIIGRARYEVRAGEVRSCAKREDTDDQCGQGPCIADARVDGDMANIVVFAAASATHIVMIAALQAITATICAIANAAYDIVLGTRRMTARGRYRDSGCRRHGATRRAGTARVRQKRTKGKGAHGIRATCRRLEAWMLAYLAVSNHLFTGAGIGGDVMKRVDADWTHDTTHAYEEGATWTTLRDNGQHGTGRGCGTARLDWRRDGFDAADRDFHWWVHASRVGEAANPGPAQPTIAVVGLLRRAGDRIRAAVSYPRPGKGCLKGAVAAGFPDGGEGQSGQASHGEDAFALRVEAVNATGWRALQRRLMATNAQVVLAQETWLTQDAVPAASSWSRRRGWQSLWAAAVTGPNGGASGGVAIFAREGIGLHHPPAGTHVISPGRAVAAVVQAPGHRPTIFVSCYLCHGKGPNGKNLGILAAIGQRLAALKESYEFVLGGTSIWNLPTSRLQASRTSSAPPS